MAYRWRTTALTTAALFLALSPGNAAGQTVDPTPAPIAATSPEPTERVPPEVRLSWHQPIECMADEHGETVFVQCDHKQKICRYHNGCFPGTSGKTCKKLLRLKRDCPRGSNGNPSEVRRLRKAGYRFDQALAEAPPGWARDERGRVFQTHFNMNRRVWLGAHWTPSFGQAERKQLGRVGFDLGLRTETLSADTRTRHRFRVLEGQFTVNPLTVNATLFRYSSSREAQYPLFRFTTFWPPARHDLHGNLGWFNEILGVQYRPRGSEDETVLRFAAAGMSWDLWHDLSMQNFVRIRTGAAFEDRFVNRDDDGHHLASTPLAVLECDVIFDPAGQHRLTVASGYQAPLFWNEADGPVPQVGHRFVNEIAYELMFLAINDQPVTLRTAAHGGYRNDLLEPVSGWELAGSAGLRLSFWAPPPEPDQRQRIHEARGR